MVALISFKKPPFTKDALVQYHHTAISIVYTEHSSEDQEADGAGRAQPVLRALVMP